MGNCCSASEAAIEPVEETSYGGTFQYKKGTCALEYWEPIKLVGEGSISSIHLVQRRPERVEIPYQERADIMRLAADRADQEADPENAYVLKSIMKDHVVNDRYLEEMRNEIYTMSHLDHPNIVKVLEAYERKRHIYLIMEYCSGGDLQVVQGGSEEYAQEVIKHLLQAVKYLHEHKVVHRDLKLENIMFKDSKRDPKSLKIIDFGLSTRYLSDDYKSMTDKVGTIYTMSPQVLQGVYDFKCDLWSIGVIAYDLLSGSLPFWGPVREMPWPDRREIMIDRIMRGQYKRMIHGRWDNVSKEAKNFVAALLQLDPELRPTAAQALNLPWMLKTFSHNSSCCGESGTDVQLRNKKFKELALGLLVGSFSCDELLDLKSALAKYDPYNTGVIGFHDFQKALTETNKWSEGHVDGTFSELGDGCVEYVDFIVAAIEGQDRLETERVADCLDQLKEKESCCEVSKEVSWRRANTDSILFVWLTRRYTFLLFLPFHRKFELRSAIASVRSHSMPFWRLRVIVPATRITFPAARFSVCWQIRSENL